jgi:hypothetical protein
MITSFTLASPGRQPASHERPQHAVVSMRVEDYFANGKRWWVRLHE